MKSKKKSNEQLKTVDKSLISFKELFKKNNKKNKSNDHFEDDHDSFSDIREEITQEQLNLVEENPTKKNLSEIELNNLKRKQEAERLSKLKNKIISTRDNNSIIKKDSSEYNSKKALLNKYDFSIDQNISKKDNKAEVSKDKSRNSFFDDFVEFSKQNFLENNPKDDLEIEKNLKSEKKISYPETNIDDDFQNKTQEIILESISSGIDEMTKERNFIDNSQKTTTSERYIYPNLKSFRNHSENEYYLISENRLAKEYLEKLNELFENLQIIAKVNSYLISSFVTTFKIIFKSEPTPLLLEQLKTKIKESLQLDKITFFNVDKKTIYAFEIINQKFQTIYYKNLFEKLENQLSNQENKIYGYLGETTIRKGFALELKQSGNILIYGKNKSEHELFFKNLLLTLFLKYNPEEINLVFLNLNNGILDDFKILPHLFMEILDTPFKALKGLENLLEILNYRENIFAKNEIDNIDDYNSSITSKEEKLPFIIVFIDDLNYLFPADKIKAKELMNLILNNSAKHGLIIISGLTTPIANEEISTLFNLFSTKLLTYSDAPYPQDLLFGEREINLSGNNDLIILNKQWDYTKLQLAKISDEELTKLLKEFVPVYDAKREIFIDKSAKNDIYERTKKTNSSEEIDEELLAAVKIILEKKEMIDAKILQEELNISYQDAMILEEKLKKKEII